MATSCAALRVENYAGRHPMALLLFLVGLVLVVYGVVVLIRDRAYLLGAVAVILGLVILGWPGQTYLGY